MSTDRTASKTVAAYAVWDLTTRLFHWINVLCVIGLSFIGTAFLYEDELGLSQAGVLLLKTVHVYLGYVFVLNLLWRIVWGFVGGTHARWKAILPLNRGFVATLRQYVGGLKSGNPPTYLGHDPLGRLMITALLIVLVAQAGTGLLLAGTDLYKPPFGGVMAEWATGGDPEKLANLKPGSKEFIDPAGYDEMRAFRKPVKEIHELAFYILLALIALHVSGAIYAEVRTKHGLISALFSGHKWLPGPPVDAETESEE